MEIMSKLDRKQYDRDDQSSLDPNTRRSLKIALYKKRKQLQTKLEQLKEKRKILNVDENEEFSFEQEALEHEFWSVQLKQAVSDGVQLVQRVEEEFILAKIHEKPEEEKRKLKMSIPPKQSDSRVTFIGPDGKQRVFQNLAEFRANATQVQQAISNPGSAINIQRIKNVPSTNYHHRHWVSQQQKEANKANTSVIDQRVDQIVNRRDNTFKEYVEPWKYSVEQGFDFDVASGKVKLDSGSHDDCTPKKQVDEMNEEEHNEHQKEKRRWDSFTEDVKKGSGNPYYDDRA